MCVCVCVCVCVTHVSDSLFCVLLLQSLSLLSPNDLAPSERPPTRLELVCSSFPPAVPCDSSPLTERGYLTLDNTWPHEDSPVVCRTYAHTHKHTLKNIHIHCIVYIHTYIHAFTHTPHTNIYTLVKFSSNWTDLIQSSSACLYSHIIIYAADLFP